MIRYVLPTIFALFIWWSSTVLIMLLYRRPQTTRWSFPLATLAAAAALVGLWVTRHSSDIAGAYIGFVCGVTICGWHLLGFYTGMATGPQLQAQHHTWPRLLQAIYASLYHELLGIALAVLAVALTWGAVNQVGTFTLLILWLMHQSARLNVLLGVRNFDTAMLPAHLDWVKRLVVRRHGNLFFPFSIVVTSSLTVVLGLQALAPGTSTPQAVGWTFLCLMMALALLEHALLILPAPSFARQLNPAPPPGLLPEE